MLFGPFWEPFSIKNVIKNDAKFDTEKTSNFRENTFKIHSKNDAKIDIFFIKKTSFQKRVNVLKPLFLLCRIHMASGLPIKKSMNKSRKIHAEFMLEKVTPKSMNKYEK